MIDAIYVRSRSIVTRFIAAINPALDLRMREDLALFLTASLEGLTVFAGHGRHWAGEMDRLKAIACDTLIEMVRNARPASDIDPDWRAPTMLDAETYARLTEAGA